MEHIPAEDKLRAELDRIRKVRLNAQSMVKIKDEIKKEKAMIKEANRIDLNPAIVKAGKKVRDIAGSAVRNATKSLDSKSGFGNLFEPDLTQAPKGKKRKNKIDIFDGVL